MPEEKQTKHHIYLGANGTANDFTSPRGGAAKFRFPSRDRQVHGKSLLEQLGGIQAEFQKVEFEREAHGVFDQDGLIITLQGDPDFELPLESVEDLRAGFEVLNVRHVGSRIEVTMRVPPGKLASLEKKIRVYLDEEKLTTKGKPKNQPLVESIAQIRTAALEQLWTDDTDLIPGEDDQIWWEVWLRAGSHATGSAEAFRRHGGKLGLEVKPGNLVLLDRTVVLAFGSRSAMSASAELLDCIAELRKAKVNPADYLWLSPFEQAEWSDELLERTTEPDADAPALCLLDTGVNNGHPLIRIALADQDLMACDPSWGTDDHHPQGHGTAMAGIGLFGSLLNELLAGKQAIDLVHRLESVKLLPRHGANKPELFGLRTAEAIYMAEANAPQRGRCVCTTVTFPEGRDRGFPTSWSAAVDQLAAGTDGESTRLVVLSAGNTPQDSWNDYPDSCHMESIHDPGQAWNALTVGGHTTKVDLDARTYNGWKLIASEGGLSPCSTTSLTWNHKWPLKPDIVFEAGNAALDPATGEPDTLEDLGLLTTHHDFPSRLYTTTGQTSAAAVQCARLGAVLQAEYPALRAETIRALIVHSARWTARMQDDFPPVNTNNRRNLLRCYGFGVPDQKRAVWSASNALTLVVEDQLRPFRFDNGAVKTGEMKTHRLPWPRQVLLALGETPVELRVTLSYFVEPNPGRRGWSSRHAYASHGLRFDLMRPRETSASFEMRLNKAARDEEDDSAAWAAEPDTNWTIGPQERFRGSIHSDRWSGTAADLATRDIVGIYPVSGWWKTRKKLERYDSEAPYSLIVSIHTPEEKMDVYTPVEAQVGIPVVT